MVLVICHVCTYENEPNNSVCELCNANLRPIDNTVNQNYKSVLDNFIQSFNINLQQTNKLSKIQENYELAMDIIPESFVPINLLYIPMVINGESLTVLVDTGAQISVISEDCADRCGLSDLIDRRVQHEVKGVGSQMTVGRVWMVDVEIGIYSVPCSFTVLKKLGHDAIFGLDMLMSHNCSINFQKRTLTIGDYSIDFIQKKIPESKV